MHTVCPMKQTFVDELNETVERAVNKYDNIFIAGDINIDTGDKFKDTNNYLCDFRNTFSLNNLTKVRSCQKSASGTILDIMLTNKRISLQQALVTATKSFLPA